MLATIINSTTAKRQTFKNIIQKQTKQENIGCTTYSPFETACVRKLSVWFALCARQSVQRAYNQANIIYSHAYICM